MFVGNLFQTLKVAFVATYPPRQCGIATYTFDLLNSLKSLYSNGGATGDQNCFEVIALNNTPQGYNYGQEVSFHIRDQHSDDYRRAADFINLSPVDVVSLQHEFGIFGGEDGSYIIRLIGALKKPVVTTLHTVLEEPSPGQKQALAQICEQSALVVVQAQMALRLLKEVYAVPEEKIAMINHGAPDVPFLDSSYYKDQFQAEGRKILFTFGLLSPNKGIEYVIEAMEQVIREFPDALYLVLGATHPEVKRRFGEQYRHSLEKLVRDKGLKEHVTFYNQYVSIERLVQFLVATDIYVTPYVNKEQIVSGTLAYALACGKAIVSTPYWYARELLAEERGCLVPFSDSKAMADALILLLRDEALRNRMRKLAYQHGRQMIWREVARSYAAGFEKALLNYSSSSIPSLQSTAVIERSVLPEINLDHLRILTDDTGLFQHALFTVPDRHHGYCTDDNARALIVTITNWRLFKDEAIMPLLHIYLSFLNHALNTGEGRMRNFLSYNRQWQEEVGSEDSHGRSIWALGYTIVHPPNEAILGLANRIFKQCIGTPGAFTSPRAWAFSLIGGVYYLKRFGGDTEVRGLVTRLGKKLLKLFVGNLAEDWFWCEDIVAYDNARLPQALIMAGKYLENEEMLSTGLQALNWLISVQTDPEEGHLSLVGNDGWYRRGAERARFDQQPLEAAALVDACYQAYVATGQPRWRIVMDWSFNWFFGNNDAHQTLFDFSSGGCRDGLQPGGVNQNQGGESTLSLLMALQRMHLVAHQGSIYQAAGEGSRHPFHGMRLGIV